MRILVVEDEVDLANTIQRGLKEAGYGADVAYDGEEAENFIDTYPYDLIILDIILPKEDGFEVCQSMRKKDIHSKILMLTCRGEIESRVKGLDSGTDDYLVKPFAFAELLARIRALLRRQTNSIPPILKVSELVLNTATREVKVHDKVIELTGKEYSILEYLMRNPNIIVTRRLLEEHVWDMSLESESNLIDVYIRKIRQKIDREDQKSRIETVRGAGYMLRTHEDWQ